MNNVFLSTIIEAIYLFSNLVVEYLLLSHCDGIDQYRAMIALFLGLCNDLIAVLRDPETDLKSAQIDGFYFMEVMAGDR